MEIYAGDYTEIEVSLVDIDGNPLSLVGVSATYQISESIGTTPLVTKTTDDDVEVITDVKGNTRLKIKLYSTDTENLEGIYYQEFEVKDADGKPYTVLAGNTLAIKPTAIKG